MTTFKVGNRVRWRKDDDGFNGAHRYGADGVVTIDTISGAGDDPHALLTFEGQPHLRHWACRFEHVPAPALIDPAKKYVTRDGREVRIYATDGNDEYAVHGAVKDDGEWRPYGWYPDGAYLQDEENGLDLVEVKPEASGWVNFNRNLAGSVYPRSEFFATKEQADKCATPQRIACLHLTVRDGDGLEGK